VFGPLLAWPGLGLMSPCYFLLYGFVRWMWHSVRPVLVTAGDRTGLDAALLKHLARFALRAWDHAFAC
jgi:hypothetical protein